MGKTDVDLIIDIGKTYIKFFVFKKNGFLLKKKIFQNNFLLKKTNYSEINHQKLIYLIKKEIKLFSEKYS